jgi:hypothetical protein
MKACFLAEAKASFAAASAFFRFSISYFEMKQKALTVFL